jgi:hypothetical protein
MMRNSPVIGIAPTARQERADAGTEAEDLHPVAVARQFAGA